MYYKFLASFFFGILLLIQSDGFSESKSSAFDKKWKNCSTKQDCIPIRGCCGWSTASKKNQKQFEKYENEICASTECRTAPDFTHKPHLECRKSQCQIDNSVPKDTESNIACLSSGQVGFVGGVPGSNGWNLQTPCCSGLKDRESLSVCGKGYGGGYNYVCIACGDQKCDKRFESNCNCPEDCK